MKHTPGPWKKEGFDVWGNNSRQYSRMIASCRPDNGTGPYKIELSNECVSNAHLIAAAPELLEACNLIDFIPEGWEMPLGWNQIAAQIRHAIAKAEGKET
jgi:hypothetical protein